VGRLLAAVVALATVLAGSGLLLGGGAVGPVAAQDGGETLADETIAVDNETRSVYALAENTTDGYPITVTVYNVTEQGIEQEVASGTLNATGDNATDLFEVTDLDPENVSSYRVVVTGDGETVERVEVGAVREVTGGGGGLGFSAGGGTPIALVGVIALVGAALYFGRDA
jgi:hypothetical protein